MRNKYLSFFVILFSTFSASVIGSFVTNLYKEPWYSQLILPTFNPPSWVFAPVWSILYFFMSVAAWRVWNGNNNKKILSIYFVHLFFNAIWSIIFFGLHNIGLAMVNLIIIILFILILLNLYKQNDKISYYLMIPYLLWSCYALLLNFSIFVLN